MIKILKGFPFQILETDIISTYNIFIKKLITINKAKFFIKFITRESKSLLYKTKLVRKMFAQSPYLFLS